MKKRAPIDDDAVYIATDGLRFLSGAPIKFEGGCGSPYEMAIRINEPEVAALMDLINDRARVEAPTAKLHRALKWMEKQSRKGWKMRRNG